MTKFILFLAICLDQFESDYESEINITGLGPSGPTVVYCKATHSEEIEPISDSDSDFDPAALEANQFGINEKPEGCVLLRTTNNDSIMKFTKPLCFPEALLKKWKKIVN